MNNKIQHLSNEEQTLILNAPIYVSALISGVDGEFHPEEIKKAVNIIHIKSFSETKDIRGVYAESNQESEEKIEMLIDALPIATSERNDVLIQKLSGLNDIFPKLDSTFAFDLYNSLRELAYYVSTASESEMTGFQNELEKEVAKLPFLNAPELD
jgi:hypothetical protein